MKTVTLYHNIKVRFNLEGIFRVFHRMGFLNHGLARATKFFAAGTLNRCCIVIAENVVLHGWTGNIQICFFNSCQSVKANRECNMHHRQSL